MKTEDRGLLGLLIILVIGYVGWGMVSGLIETVSPSCSTQISKCKDNKDVIENYGNLTKAKVACMTMADRMANYGKPQWPSYGAFARYEPGDDYPKRNAVTLFDSDVLFENGFGAKQRTPLRCDYDYATGTAVVLAE